MKWTPCTSEPKKTILNVIFSANSKFNKHIYIYNSNFSLKKEEAAVQEACVFVDSRINNIDKYFHNQKIKFTNG